MLCPLPFPCPSTSDVAPAEAFSFYTKGKKKIALKKLRPLMMSLGIALTDEEFAIVFRNVRDKHPQATRGVTFPQFISIVKTEPLIKRAAGGTKAWAVAARRKRRSMVVTMSAS